MHVTEQASQPHYGLDVVMLLATDGRGFVTAVPHPIADYNRSHLCSVPHPIADYNRSHLCSRRKRSHCRRPKPTGARTAATEAQGLAA